MDELERLSLRLSEIVRRDFMPLDSQQLNWRPAAHKWSILECIQHLNYFAAYYFPALERCLKRGAHTQPLSTFTSNWLGVYYLQKYRMPDSNQLHKTLETPRQYQPLEAATEQSSFAPQTVLSAFEDHQQQLLDFLRQAQTVNLQQIKVPAFWLGWVKLRLGDLLQILIYHNERHIVQAQRVLYHDQFPGNVSLDALLTEL